MQSPSCEHWLAATREEFEIIQANKTWTDVHHSSPSSTAEILPTGMVLLIKRDADGNVRRFNARLVVRGNFLATSYEYTKLYAPVSCIELVCLLLTVTVPNGSEIHQLDVKGAFLHAELSTSDKVCIRLHKIEGMTSSNGQLVRLLKSLFELKKYLSRGTRSCSQTCREIGFAERHIVPVC